MAMQNIYMSQKDRDFIKKRVIGYENGDIVFVVQPRVHTRNTVTVEAPAGMIDEGEEALEAARRELEEETGCIAEKIIKVAEGYSDPGSSSGITNLYIILRKGLK